jgi:hypothetical protein
MTRAKAHVVIENRTGSDYKFQLLHQYTGECTEETEYVYIPNGKKRYFLAISHRLIS